MMSLITNIAGMSTTSFGTYNTTDAATTGLDETEFVTALTGAGVSRDDAIRLFNAYKGNDTSVSSAEFQKMITDFQAANNLVDSSTLGNVAAYVAMLESVMLARLEQTDGLTLADTISLSAQLNMNTASMTQFLKIFGAISEQLNNAAAPRG
jgi:hypothetical protein